MHLGKYACCCYFCTVNKKLEGAICSVIYGAGSPPTHLRANTIGSGRNSTASEERGGQLDNRLYSTNVVFLPGSAPGTLGLSQQIANTLRRSLRSI